MGILNWKKIPTVEQADLDYVALALLPGDKRLKRSIYGDKQARKNWGCLYRACVRLMRCGEIAGFTLRRSGELRIKWTVTDKLSKSVIPKKHNVEYLQPSAVHKIEHKEDSRKTAQHKKYKLDTTPTFKPYDYAPSRLLVEDRLFKDHAYLHSEEARVERVNKKRYQEKAGGATDKWGEKFKYRADYFTDVILGRKSSVVFVEHCKKRGFCVWPSPVYVVQH